MDQAWKEDEKNGIICPFSMSGFWDIAKFSLKKGQKLQNIEQFMLTSAFINWLLQKMIYIIG